MTGRGNVNHLPINKRSVQRRNSYRAIFVLTMLLYGRHSSVTWLTSTRVRVTTATFGRALSLTAQHVRTSCEWLLKHKYATWYDSGHGWVEIDLVRPPVRRGVSDDGDHVERVDLDTPGADGFGVEDEDDHGGDYASEQRGP